MLAKAQEDKFFRVWVFIFGLNLTPFTTTTHYTPSTPPRHCHGAIGKPEGSKLCFFVGSWRSRCH